mgnify:CR=1 FL=1
MALVQKFIVEDASKASSLLPQHVALVDAEGNPIPVIRQAANPGSSPTVKSVVDALVAAGIMAAQEQ